MEYKSIDMDSYKRRSHFEYFSSLAYPYVGTTVNIDITGLPEALREKGAPFFLSFCYCVSVAANSIPEFRHRILDGAIVEFEHCRTSHTLALDDGTYCYCTLHSQMSFPQYIEAGLRAQKEAINMRSLGEEGENDLDKIFISTLPWFTYTSLVQPVPFPADSNPRITWGKYFRQNGTTLIPVTVLCHHGLVDGLHIAAFYRVLSEQVGKLIH